MNINSKSLSWQKNQIAKFFITFIFFIIILIPFLLVNGQTLPPASTPTATLGPGWQDKDIVSFKEKIATKVAQLQQKNTKVITGYVVEVNDTQLRLRADDNQSYEIKLDQLLTKFYKIKANEQKEIKLSDIKKDDYIIVSGVQNDKSINANFIVIDEEFAVLSGKVVELDKKNYTLKVLTNDRDIYQLDIETTTKQEIINIQTLAIERAGFSKIKEGDIIHFVIKKTAQTEKENKYKAEKILIIPQEYFLK